MMTYCPDPGCGIELDLFDPPRDEWVTVFCPGTAHGAATFSFHVLVYDDQGEEQ